MPPKFGSALSRDIWGSKVYNEQVNDEPGNYGAGFLGLRLGWAGGLLDTPQKSEAMMVGMTYFMCDLCLKNYVSFLGSDESHNDL